MATLTAYLPSHATTGEAATIEVLHSRPKTGRTGDDPTYGPLRSRPRLRCRRIRLRDATRPSEAVIEAMLGDDGGRRIEDVPMLKFDERIRIDRVRNGKRRTLFEGFVVGPQIGWEADRETVAYRVIGFETRLEDSLVLGQIHRPPDHEADQRYGPDQLVRATALPARFNPAGRPNAVDAGWADSAESKPLCVFTEPDDPDATHWTAAAAVEYLLRTCNASRRWVHNPSRQHLQEVFGDAVLGDVMIDQQTPADALRRICRLTGRGMRVSPRPRSDGSHSLRFYRLGDGRRRTARLNAAGSSVIASAASDAVAGDVQWNIEKTVNKVTGLGDASIIEATFEANPTETTDLVMGWYDEDVDLYDHLDGYSVNELSPDLHQMIHARGEDFQQHRDTLRLWVLNEDGAFTISPYDAGDSYDFSTLFGTPNYVRRKRPFRQPLAMAGGGARRPITVQISYDSGGSWYPLDDFESLSDRAGIRITAEDLFALCPAPEEGEQAAPEANYLQAFHDETLRLRVTAAVETDQRLTADAGPDADSPTRFTRHKAFEAAEQYALATVDPSSAFADEDARTRDDTDRLAGDARQRLLAADAADVTARHELFGLRTDMRIGDRLVRLVGRGISYRNRRGGSAGHPQIVEIVMEFLDRWTTTVHTRSLHREIS